MLRFIFITISFLFFSSCADDNSALEYHVLINKTQSSSNLNLLLKRATKLTVEVIYEAGAQPYTENQMNRNQPLWNLLENNIKAIYEARGMTVDLVIPKLAKDMKMVDTQDKDSWTADEISSFIAANRVHSPSETEGVIYVLFVNGHFNNGESINRNVIGVNVTGTTDIAIFKDVVKNMGPVQDGMVAKFSEQSTLVHEFGHAMGLVNNGVNQVSEHHDSEHGAHCSNPSCVMYWMNEGTSKMVDYVNEYIKTGDEVMFKASCLEDITNY
ncbi:putative lipoprotein [Bacteriovorax sp. Seq25_V]|uniref:putative lipoprotein n=1 Tax=Bacteriovorax sp. Seq25_V TaxID=1201288 RepID=UPI000389F45F|nr:putative lipoprotein [Bacteriovorax sp. Seq25_V]EQC47730.1 putative lipoprotein [Bacteriovorax sp. Seq25_V]